MEYPKEIFVKDYFEIHEYYSKIYGKDRTIILMQVGSFHECYCTDNDGLDLVSLSQQLDVICTRKNSNIPLSKANPRMMGFPVFTTRNFIDKLINLNYTIVLIDQVTEPPTPKRKVTGIFSPGTFIEHKTTKTLYLVSLVIDKIKQVNNYNLCLGLSAYDLSTGEGSFYETYSNNNDILSGLDNTLRFLEKYPPREIILHDNLDNEIIGNMTSDDITNYLGIEKKNTFTINITNHKKISYQKMLLEKIYKCETNMNIIELLELQFLNWGRLSLVLLLEYVINHQQHILEKLTYPKQFITNNYLYLGNKAIEQLDIFSKEKGLFDIINYTKTAIGKRYLKDQLIMPLININDINNRYKIIDTIIKGKHYDNITSYLEDIYDLDKLIRKIEINIIQPCELNQLYISIYQVSKLVEYLNNNKLLKLFNIKDTTNITDFINHIIKLFDLNKINELNFNNFTETNVSFYNKNIYNDIDELQNNIEITQNFMVYLINELENIIVNTDNVIFKKTKTDTESKSLLTLKCNDRDGYYLLITNRRCDILRKNLEKYKIIKIGSIELKTSDLEFTQLPKSSNTKINCKKIQEISNELIILKNTLAKKLKEYFKLDIQKISQNFSDLLRNWSLTVSFIDFINSGALCAIHNHYTRPNINVKNISYFKSKDMRHPIIEQINTEYKYVPQDIDLDGSGILLFGINSSGKSTLMKSIGLNIILAQIGYYTATSCLEFNPYHSLFTRINGNDNMFKGQSSFMVEMMELMTILKRNNANTLVLADEIARGTENISSNVIVSYMIETLAKSQTSFITATHLHDITSIESIKKLDNIKIKHLKITYDAKDDKLIYDRILSDGQGESFYGLQVAKYLMKDNYFNERTQQILNEYNSINIKTSKYNKDVYLSECFICSDNKHLESHHIIWQKEFDENNYHKEKIYLKKNDSSNLVVLCMKCHDKVDRNDIEINGWIETSNGKKLDYKIKNNNNVKQTKYTQELIDYIKSLKNITNDAVIARILIKDNYNIKVSTKTILNYWKL
jgi:DNA mismatch repair protein MutS